MHKVLTVVLGVILTAMLYDQAAAQVLPDSTPKLPPIKADAKIESHLGRPRVGHWVQIQLGTGSPGGELRNRFGQHGQVSAGYNVLFPSHWTLGSEATYGYSRQLRQDPLSSLRDANGDIIAKDGSLATVDVSEQLWMLPTLKFGKMFILRKRKKTPDWEQALLVQLGYTWFQYKYGINSVSNDVAQIEGKREQGYDRLASGPGGVAEVTYFLQAPQANYGLFAKVQYMVAATQSRREYDYNYGRPTTGTLWASSLSFSLGFALTFYRLDEKDYFYY